MSAPMKAERALSLVVVALSVFVAVLVNVVSARHFTRWDLTRDKRYTLSSATLSTLSRLPEPVHVWVLMGQEDPIAQSVKQLLTEYQGATSKLEVHVVDPDRDTLQYAETKKRFHLDRGRTSEGRVVEEAVIIVSRAEKYWFVYTQDLVEARPQEGKVEPKEEQAITMAIRNVLGGEKPKVCFSTGHGEMSIQDGSERGLGFFRDILERNNYETAQVDLGTNAPHPFLGCAVAFVAGPRGGFTVDEAERIRTYLLEGGNGFFAVSPWVDGESFADPGLDPVLRPFGISLESNVVVETDPKVLTPEPGGVRFFATAKTHPVTEGLVRTEEKDAPRVMLRFSRSLSHAAKDAGAAPIDLLVSTKDALGAKRLRGAELDTDTDVSHGPLVFAMASERAKISPSAPHGARIVVVGTSSVLSMHNWQQPFGTRGAALFVESALSWLASNPEIVDIPSRSQVTSAIALSDASRTEIQRYVLIYMPLAVALLGIAVALRRRSTEGEGPRKANR